MSLEETYAEIKKAVGDRLEFESFKVVKSVEEHRNFWKPDKVRVLLLAESHVFTRDSEHDAGIRYPKIPELEGVPEGYVKLVYCLGYGEKRMVMVAKNRGTPQFWKIFVSCLSWDVGLDGKKILLGGTRFSERIRNKISVLERLKEKGIWLVDASIVALYNDAKKPDPDLMERIIRISWEGHVSEVIRKSNPEKIIVIGKGVGRTLGLDLGSTGIPVHVQTQPQGLRSRQDIDDAHENYYRWCNE